MNQRLQEVINANYDRLRLYSYSVCRKHYTNLNLEDVFHDALAGMLKNGSSYEGVLGDNPLQDSRFRNWFTTVVMHKAADYLREMYRRKSFNETDISKRIKERGGLDVSPFSTAEFYCEDRLEKEDESRKLLEYINRLNQNSRKVIALHYLEGMNYDAISKLLGIPKNTVKSRLFHAMVRLREDLVKSLNGDEKEIALISISKMYERNKTRGNRKKTGKAAA